VGERTQAFRPGEEANRIRPAFPAVAGDLLLEAPTLAEIIV
jgi:hypothetical protein